MTALQRNRMPANRDFMAAFHSRCSGEAHSEPVLPPCSCRAIPRPGLQKAMSVILSQLRQRWQWALGPAALREAHVLC